MNDVLPPTDVRLMNAAAAALIGLALLMALALVVNRAVRHPVFALQGIRVEGDVRHNNALTLRANVAPRLAGNFFTLDLQAARAAFESVPWVRSAVVRREFPNRLRVTLQEHQAAAFWGAEGDSRLVNTHGEVFEADGSELEEDELPRLDGPQGQAARMLGAWRALAPLFERQGAQLAELELSSRGQWRAKLDTGGRIELGRGESADLAMRVDRLLSTLTQVAARYGRQGIDDLESADLRHTNGYALRLRGLTTSAPEATRK